jgi:hypothetical protein
MDPHKIHTLQNTYLALQGEVVDYSDLRALLASMVWNKFAWNRVRNEFAVIDMTLNVDAMRFPWKNFGEYLHL